MKPTLLRLEVDFSKLPRCDHSDFWIFKVIAHLPHTLGIFIPESPGLVAQIKKQCRKILCTFWIWKNREISIYSQWIFDFNSIDVGGYGRTLDKFNQRTYQRFFFAMTVHNPINHLNRHANAFISL